MRAKRQDAARLRWLHDYCMTRDEGRCRVPHCLVTHSYWADLLELAHCWEWKRARTRGLPPDERHPTWGAMMLCRLHHQMEEAHRLVLLPLSKDYADGPVSFVLDGLERGTS